MSGTTRTLADLKDALAAQQAAQQATAPAAGTPAAPSPDAVRREPKRDQWGRSYATGRRKDAVARVW
ncbi:MAG TPA: hypothetical protein VFN42_03810, partial [Acetobacteraceae bacterium]|nr:hypothetical protein [Acetobacteraceae bacterium]